MITRDADCRNLRLTRKWKLLPKKNDMQREIELYREWMGLKWIQMGGEWRKQKKQEKERVKDRARNGKEKEMEEERELQDEKANEEEKEIQKEKENMR